MITLYSNHCVRCDILKQKLDSKNVSYNLVDKTEDLIEKGLANEFFPILEVDGKLLNFGESNDYVNSL